MRRPLILLALAAIVGCTARAGAALLPQLDLRASARRERSESQRRWAHDVRLTATFRTDARLPPAPPPEPPDHAPPVALPGRLPCRVPALCAWEADARQRAIAGFHALDP